MHDEDLVEVHFSGSIKLTRAEIDDARSVGQAIQNLVGSQGAVVEDVYDLGDCQ